MDIIEALEKIEQAPLGNARLEVLQKADSAQLREILTLALSPQITFGVKKLPKYQSRSAAFRTSDWHTKLLKLLDLLSSRELTGNAAQEAIEEFLGSCNSVQAKWAERVIKQDLRLNIGAKDVNNTLGKGTIFQFTVPLAEDFNKVNDEHLAGRWCVQPKLDGARTVAYMPANSGRVRLYSRSGKEYLNFESVRSKLQEINNTRNQAQDIVLDGEVVSYVEDRVDFQALQATLFRKDGVETGKLKFLVFDGCTQKEWEQPAMEYAERYNFAFNFVTEVVRENNGAVSKIGVVPSFITTDPDRERLLKYSRDFVMQGFEGAMLRRATVEVKLKRSRDLLKVKTFHDDEAELVGLAGGTGKYDGVLGALICKTKDGKQFEIGSGFTDDQRRTYWRNRAELPKLVSFKYQELTDDGKPRFPVFKGFRHEADTSNG